MMGYEEGMQHAFRWIRGHCVHVDRERTALANRYA